MKKKLGCVTTTLVAGVVIYGIWVCFPRSRYAAEAQTVLKQATDRDKADRELANDQANNGYLNPTLLPFWGRKDIESKKDTPVRKTMDAELDYSDLREGRDTGLEGAVRVRDPQVMARFRAFEEVYPEVRKAARAKKFLVPWTDEVSSKRLIPNLLAFRMVTHAGAGYAEYLALQGKGDEALAVAGDMLAFAQQVRSQQGGLIMLMISTAMQQIAQQASAMVLESSHPSPEALRQFAKTLEQTQLSKASFPQVMENELLMASNSLEHIGDEEPDTKFLNYLPGLTARELRMYHNEYMPMVLAYQKGEVPVMPPVEEFGVVTWLLGQRSYAGAIFIPNSKRAQAVFNLARKRQGFLHLYTVLRLQKPASLKDLKDYKPLDGFDPSQVVYAKGELRLKQSPEELAFYSGKYEPAPGMEKWSGLDMGRPEWVLMGPVATPAL